MDEIEQEVLDAYRAGKMAGGFRAWDPQPYGKPRDWLIKVKNIAWRSGYWDRCEEVKLCGTVTDWHWCTVWKEEGR